MNGPPLTYPAAEVGKYLYNLAERRAKK